MRTTLDIDDDVLLAAKELAAKQRTTAGKILSEFFRRAHRIGQLPPVAAHAGAPYPTRNGVPVVPSRGEVVTAEHVRRLMEQQGI